MGHGASSLIEKKKKGIGHMTYPGVKVEEVPDKDPFDFLSKC